MTRKGLHDQEGKRGRYRARFVRYGMKPQYRGAPVRTLLLQDLLCLEEGKVVADHQWFTETASWRALGALVEGDVVEFDARVKPYKAGYRGRDWERGLENPPRMDYKLAWPTRMERL